MVRRQVGLVSWKGGSGRSLGVAFGACSTVRTLASLLRETRAKERLLSRKVGEWDNRPQSQKTHTYVWDRVWEGDSHRLRQRAEVETTEILDTAEFPVPFHGFS